MIMKMSRHLFTEAEWKELTEDRIKIPAIPCEIVKLVGYGKKH